MNRTLPYAAAIALASTLLANEPPASTALTWTGWFSDLDCATSTTKGGVIAPTNPECAKKCLAKGTAPAFISEQAKGVYAVKGRDVTDDLGYHVEIQAHVDESARSIEVVSVKRLEHQGASCRRPRKSSSGQ
jgi:hypothetical protein